MPVCEPKYYMYTVIVVLTIANKAIPDPNFKTKAEISNFPPYMQINKQTGVGHDFTSPVTNTLTRIP